MKATVFRFSLYAALFEIAFYIVSSVLIKLAAGNYDTEEIVGYAGILACLSFVYFGIRHYRDHVNSGSVSFSQAVKIGLLIVLVPSVCFGLTDTLYVTIFDPHFYEKYSAHMIDELRKSIPATQLPIKIKEMKAQMDFYKSPFVNFMLMFVTVAAIGIVITLLSTVLLMRKSATKSDLSPFLQN